MVLFMIVKILGSGCTKCKKLEQRLYDLKERHQLTIEIQKVTRLDDIISYGVMMTPGLVINEKLMCSGKIPDDTEILNWIREM